MLRKKTSAPVITHTIHLLDSTGDTPVATWSPADEITIEKARVIFDQLVAEGHLTYDASDPAGSVVTRTFDPEAERIIARRPMAGG